jgi:hypothetical protein
MARTRIKLYESVLDAAHGVTLAVHHDLNAAKHELVIIVPDEIIANDREKLAEALHNIAQYIMSLED